MSPTFRSLRVRNYRLFASGQAVSLIGTWAQRVAQDWLVLQLTHSGTALGVVTGLQFLPTALFSLYGGVLADRFDKRKLLIWTQVAYAVLAGILGVLDVTHVVTAWQVYVMAFLLGVTAAVDVPVRQSFVVEMVGPADLPNAVGLNSANFNSARIVGPAVAGVLIGIVGTGWIFLGNAVSYLGVIVGLLAMRPAELHPAKPLQRQRGQLMAGLRYVRGRPDLMMPMVLVGIVGTFGLNFQITLALMSKQSFGLPAHRAAAVYGFLSAAFAVGSLLGALGSARRGQPRTELMYAAAFAFGLFEIICGFMPTYWTLLIALVFTGMTVLTMTTTANSTCQLRSAPSMRGRVMAIYVLVFLGGTPLGAPLIGVVAQTMGPRWSLWVGGAISALAAVGCALAYARMQKVRVRAHLLPRPHFHVVGIASGAASTIAHENAFDQARSA